MPVRKTFTQEVLQWFNVNNSSNFILNAEDVLFDLSSASDTLTKKSHCYTSQLQYVSWLEENKSRAIGQNSMTP